MCLIRIASSCESPIVHHRTPITSIDSCEAYQDAKAAFRVSVFRLPPDMIITTFYRPDDL